MKISFFIVLAMLGAGTFHAQVDPTSELFKTLKEKDSLLFDRAFNKCETQWLEELIATDFEFYHDQGGMTPSKEAFLKVMREGICNPNNPYTSRRELEKESLQVFPLYKDGKLYGAIQKGIHRFYETPPGKPEQPGSIAKFTHVWILEHDSWHLKRVLSYDHGPIASNKNSIAVSLSEKELKRFVGNYEAPTTGKVVLFIKEGMLFIQAGAMQAPLFASDANTFFHKEMPLEFTFVQNEAGDIVKFIVIENGIEIEEATRI